MKKKMKVELDFEDTKGGLDRKDAKVLFDLSQEILSKCMKALEDGGDDGISQGKLMSCMVKVCEDNNLSIEESINVSVQCTFLLREAKKGSKKKVEVEVHKIGGVSFDTRL